MIGTYLKGKLQNILLFLRIKNLLLFFVSWENKLNVFGLEVLVAQNKQSDIIILAVALHFLIFYDPNSLMRQSKVD